jgi:hypothetical protein
MTLTQEICNRLHELALKITDNFCYGCYKVVEGDRCPGCGTDDFMRHLAGVGVEYGTDWVVRHLLTTRLTPVEGEEMYEELLDECYPEVKIGYGTYAVSDIVKNLDPVAFRIGVQENLDSLAEDGVLFEYDGDYYQMQDLDDLLADLESE